MVNRDVFPEEVFPKENHERYVQGRVYVLSDRDDESQSVLPCLIDFLREIQVRAKVVVPIANMSHELRTPLNAILCMTEGLQEEVFGTVNEKQIQALQTFERTGSHLLELIDDILDVAKIEAGQLELDCTPTSISRLCQSSMTFIKQQAF